MIRLISLLGIHITFPVAIHIITQIAAFAKDVLCVLGMDCLAYMCSTLGFYAYAKAAWPGPMHGPHELGLYMVHLGWAYMCFTMGWDYVCSTWTACSTRTVCSIPHGLHAPHGLHDPHGLLGLYMLFILSQFG